MTLKVTGPWIAGFTDAEGSFSIYISTTEQYFGVSFTFYISQKDTEPLIKCREFLEKYRKRDPTLDDTEIPEIKPANGTMDLKIKLHNILLKVIRPFFEEFPLLSSKWQDYQLFFAALDIHLNNQISKHVRILYIAHIMFAMNTEGKQRKNLLTYYENLVKPLFDNVQEWQNACVAAKEIVKKFLLKPYPSLSFAYIAKDYFLGLVMGDGSFHADFDCREGRIATIRKSLSISLIKTDRNEKLLDAIAKDFKTAWTKRPSEKSRHSFTIERSHEINKVFQPFFLQNAEKLSLFSRRHVEIWVKVDRLFELFGGDLTNPETKSEIKALLIEIYNVHGGTYRRYSQEQILIRFQQDWNF